MYFGYVLGHFSPFLLENGDKIEKNTDVETCEKRVSQVEKIFLGELKKLKRQEKVANDAAEPLRKEATHDIHNANTSSTNLLNNVSTSLSIVGPSRGFNDGEPSYPDDPSMPHLEDFYSSPKTTLNVSLTPTIRIHTIHLKTQILRDPMSAVQTRRKVNKNFEAHALSALLHGTIHEEVYVLQPPGFVDSKFRKKVYKVVKALYGLHQDPRAWYATLSNFLETSGYRRGVIEKTLFIKQDKKDIMLVQVYVDDIIFGSTKKSWCDEFEKLMKNKFQMSSMGELTFFLGLQVNVKTASTPIETQKPLVKDKEAADVDVHLYRKSTTGGCQFLGKRLISWQCNKQTIVATFTIEAESVATAQCCGQVLWIQNQLLDYGDDYEKKLIQVLKIHTDDNVADLLTKAFDVSSNEALAIPKQTATGKEILNPFMAGSLPKTTLPTRLVYDVVFLRT
uniref:Ribonuclease H-like domain, reverse transcriptase, RNA-dependent DNA polymerase n=1 Tax=Tanacetum cinerariifolium TaxID=118510 RepID=A0A6L2NGC8_TANCI|nr:ribonuclease H-like domain, reverse transcriptase, RNA-dependent DNA polymerase [Tanacetum cinerariifolium]